MLASTLRFNGFFILLIGFLATTLNAQTDENLGCDHPDAAKGEALYQKGKKYNKTAQYDSLVYFMNQAKEVYQRIECWEKVAQMTRNLAIGYGKKKDLKAQNDAMTYAMLIAQIHLADTSVWKGKIYRYIGTNYLSRSQHDSAKIHLMAAKQIFALSGEWNEFIATCKDLARMAYFQEDFQNMENFIDTAYLYTKEKLEDQKQQLRSILQLYGALYYRNGNYERALDKHLEGLDVVFKDMTTRSDSSWGASYYNNIGLLYMEIGDIYRAEAYCKSALTLAKQIEEYRSQSTIYLNLGEFFRKKGQFQKAYNYYKKGLEVTEKIKSVSVSNDEKIRALINLNNGLAEVGPKINKFTVAKRSIYRNKKLHKKENFRRHETYRILGEVYLSEKQNKKAKSALDTALVYAKQIHDTDKHPEIARILRLMGKADAAIGELESALLHYRLAEEALQVKLDSNEVESDALISDKEALLTILEEKSRLLASEGKIVAAYNTIREATELINDMRHSFKEEGSKLFLLRRVVPIYEFTMDLSLHLYEQRGDESYLERVFYLAERSKAMLLMDALKMEDAREFGDVPDEILQEEKRLSREIARAEKDFFEASSNNDSEASDKFQEELLTLKRASMNLQKTLESNPDYKKYYDLKYETKIATTADVQAHLKEGDLLLEFFVGNQNTYIFGIDTDSIRVLKVPKNTQFELQIYALRKSLTDINFLTDNIAVAYDLFTRNAYELYTKFVKPSLRPKTERLIVISDGLLNYIPFEVMLTKQATNADADFKNLDYLLRSFPVNYHYSASLMLYERNPQKTNGKMLGMAPFYKRYNLKNGSQHQREIRNDIEDLPGARLEVEMLSNRFKGNFYFSDDANEKTFKKIAQANSFSVIHLAMHGWVDAERSQYSNLIFTYTGDSTEDDLLHAYELSLLELEADLIVLSACETGFGKYERGEGVASIGRGFMYAGAPSLVMTMWPINDQATGMLMGNFYDGLASGKAKNEAMRDAKLQYLEKVSGISAHPFFWGSFITVGDESPIQLKRKISWFSYGLIAVSVLLLGLLWRFWRRSPK